MGARNACRGARCRESGGVGEGGGEEVIHGCADARAAERQGAHEAEETSSSREMLRLCMTMKA